MGGLDEHSDTASVGGNQVDNPVLAPYRKAEQALREWLVKYGYHHEPNNKSLKSEKMWQDLFKIHCQLNDLYDKIVETPDYIKDEAARAILLPHNISLDEILDRHFS
jgi:hypothetical protein